jgi:hypothetical protein
LRSSQWFYRNTQDLLVRVLFGFFFLGSEEFFLAFDRAEARFSAEFLGVFAANFWWLAANFAFHFLSLADG